MNLTSTDAQQAQSPGASVPGLYFLATVWGFAEAMLFFIVPDVLLTWVALRGARRGLIACAWALNGALVGGVVMWCWGSADIVSATVAMDRLPAISSDMIDHVGKQLRDEGISATLWGPLQGTPYKIYAAQAGALSMSLASLVLISIPARTVRFLALTLLVAAVSGQIGTRLTMRGKRLILMGLWVSFYAGYFAVMPN